jgi:hypothetical protein
LSEASTNVRTCSTIARIGSIDLHVKLANDFPRKGGVSQLNLWYRQTSQDPAERAYAFAAAGLLTAGNWDPRTERLEDRLDAIIQAAGGNPLPCAVAGQRRHEGANTERACASSDGTARGSFAWRARFWRARDELCVVWAEKLKQYA